MKNKLYVGFEREIEPPIGGCLVIEDEVWKDMPRSAVFEPQLHGLNIMKGMNTKRARELARALYAIAPEGENTLTVRDGRRALAAALKTAKSFDEVGEELPMRTDAEKRAREEVRAFVADLLFSPLVKRVLCGGGEKFSLGAKNRIMARINRAELGEFDALVLGTNLISLFRGQLVIPDFGFYGRDQHASLIRENRLIAGCNFLGELPPKLRNAVLLIKDKQGAGATAEDAETLATYMSGFARGQEGYNSYRDAAMA